MLMRLCDYGRSCAIRVNVSRCCCIYWVMEWPT